MFPHFINQDKIDQEGRFNFEFKPGDYVCYGHCGACIVFSVSPIKIYPESDKEEHETYECMQIYYDRETKSFHTAMTLHTRCFIASYNQNNKNKKITKWLKELMIHFNDMDQLLFCLKLERSEL